MNDLEYKVRVTVFNITLTIAAYALTFVAIPVALFMVFSADKFAAGTNFLALAPVLVILLAFVMIPFSLSVTGNGPGAYLLFSMVTPIPIGLLVMAWSDWRLLPEAVYFLMASAVTYCAMMVEEPLASRRARARNGGAHAPGGQERTQKPARTYKPPVVAKPREDAPPAASGQVNHRVRKNTPEDDADAIHNRARIMKTAFQDVVGMNDLKERLLEAGQEIMHPAGAATRRNGILLFGDPGNGKTFFAEALAGELGLPIVTATFGTVVSRYIGQTPEQVAQVFRDAKAQAPCLLFLDEVDSLLKDRSAQNSTNDEAARTTNLILTELVDIREYPVVVVAATNFLDLLDQAAIREGRFDFKIEITPPDAPARKAILLRALTNYPSVRIATSALDQAVKRWDGFSVARIRAVADEAGREAVKGGREVVEYVDLQAALRTMQGRAGHMPTSAPTLDELVLPKELGEELHGLANRMREIERIEAMGGAVPTGLLFWGDPGTGKTVTAMALAKSSRWAFLSVAGNELLADPDKIRSILREAKDIRPCVVFIDEADDVLAHRQMSPHTASVTNRLLTAMDGAGGKTFDIVWIAATNHPENIDPAALRGGRFTTKLCFSLPDAEILEVFVKRWLSKSAAQFDAQITAQMIAQTLAGTSIANVQAMLQQAVNFMVDRSIRSGKPCKVSKSDLLKARDRVLG